MKYLHREPEKEGIVGNVADEGKRPGWLTVLPQCYRKLQSEEFLMLQSALRLRFQLKKGWRSLQDRLVQAGRSRSLTGQDQNQVAYKGFFAR
jgi:hypothetical protein